MEDEEVYDGTVEVGTIESDDERKELQFGYAPKLTKPRREEIVNFISAGVTQVTAACASGIGKETHHRWMRNGKLHEEHDFDSEYRMYYNAIRKAVAENEVGHVKNISKAGKDDWRASAWLLERRHSKTWARKVYVRADQIPFDALPEGKLERLAAGEEAGKVMGART